MCRKWHEQPVCGEKDRLAREQVTDRAGNTAVAQAGSVGQGTESRTVDWVGEGNRSGTEGRC